MMTLCAIPHTAGMQEFVSFSLAVLRSSHMFMPGGVLSHNPVYQPLCEGPALSLEVFVDFLILLCGRSTDVRFPPSDSEPGSSS